MCLCHCFSSLRVNYLCGLVKQIIDRLKFPLKLFLKRLFERRLAVTGGRCSGSLCKRFMVQAWGNFPPVVLDGSQKLWCMAQSRSRLAEQAFAQLSPVGVTWRSSYRGFLESSGRTGSCTRSPPGLW